MAHYPGEPAFPAWMDTVDAGLAAAETSAHASATFQAFGTAATTPVFWVTQTGDDSNNGLSPGTAKATIASAIAAASGLNGAIIQVGYGTFTEEVQLQDGLRIRGMGEQSTTIRAVSGSSNPGIFYTLTSGPVRGVEVSDLTILGVAANTTQSGIWANGQVTTGSGSGLWYSTFKNISITGFKLHGIWLKGGGTSSLAPNQFLTFSNVRAYASTTGYALFISGQVGQVVFENCQFDGPGVGTGLTNVRINRECSDNLGATVVSDRMPYAIEFVNLTCQSSVKGVYIDRAFPVNFRGGHFEGLWYGIDVVNSASAVTVDGVNFANNVASDGSGTGYCVQIGSSCYAVVRGCAVQGSVDKSFRTASGSTGILVTDGNTEIGNGYRGAGVTKQIAAGATLSLGQGKTFIVNASGTNITTLNSDLGPGEQIFLKAHGGTIQFGSGGNLTLGGMSSPVVVPADGIATFVRIDLGGTWMLASVSS